MRIMEAVTLEDEPCVLGVRASACGRPWRDRIDARGRAQALAIVQQHGVSDLLARVLVGRGVGLEEVERYLTPSIRNLLPEPYGLVDMEPAAERLANAVMRAERVAIFGDYDVDGATSSALLCGFLRHFGLDPAIHIPDRIFEGYGPNVDAIRALAAAGNTLLVTVDCGSTSHDALAEARRLGMDVVVLDHHQCNVTLPEVTALVNPNRLDDLSGQGHLAAVGVVFLTCVATLRALRRRAFFAGGTPEPDLLAFLDLVALGTVADVVPLRGVNRAFVAKGLQALAQRQRRGLTALADVARMDGPPTPYHLGFLLGPRINAGGRIGRADLGARLLLCDDDGHARELAAELDRLNTERQAVEQATLAEAEGAIERAGAVVIAHGEGWHPGVAGLVAARLKEKSNRPAFAIALDVNGIGTGSGRSIGGVDLGAAVRAAVERGLLVKGGGHAMAAGVTVKAELIEPFRAFLDERLAAEVETARSRDTLAIDASLTAASLVPALVNELERAGPFGSGNPEPVVVLPSHSVVSADAVGAAGHVRVRLRAGDGSTVGAVAFRAASNPLGRALLGSRGARLHVAGTLRVDRWGGGEKVELRILDVAYPS